MASLLQFNSGINWQIRQHSNVNECYFHIQDTVSLTNTCIFVPNALNITYLYNEMALSMPDYSPDTLVQWPLISSLNPFTAKGSPFDE